MVKSENLVGNPTNADSTITSYDAAGNSVTEDVYYWSSLNPVYIYGAKYTNTYNTATNKLSARLGQKVSGGNYTDDNRYLYFYNANNQVTKIARQVWDGSAWTVNANVNEKRYTYESYDDAVGITNQPKAPDLALSLYPVPADAQMSMAMQLSRPTDFAVVIANVYGQVIRRWEDHGAGFYTRSVPTGEFPAGVYYLSVRSADGVDERTFTVRH